jgi:hypothetical protein
MDTSEHILFHQSARLMKYMGVLILCYPLSILISFYLAISGQSASFIKGLQFLWQESPGFYAYLLVFLVLSLLLYSIKLKITSQAIYYTLAGYRISLCLKRQAVHYSFIHPRPDSLRTRIKRWFMQIPADPLNQRDGTLDFMLYQPDWRDRIWARLFRIHLSQFSHQQAREIIQAMQQAWNFKAE